MTGPLGTNASGGDLGSFSQGNPFLNVLKNNVDLGGVTNQGHTYSTWQQPASFDMDVNGYPNTHNCPSGLGESFTRFFLNVMQGQSMPYQSGPWVLSYKGGGSTTQMQMVGDGGGATVGGANGRLVFSVTPGGGMTLNVNQIGSPAAKDWYLLYSPGSSAGPKWDGVSARPAHYGNNEWAYVHDGRVAGDPWVQRHSIYRVRRMMGWNGMPFLIYGDQLPSFRSGAHLNWAGPPPYYVPIEAEVALCNDCNCDLFFNPNPLLSYADVETIARRIHDGFTDNTGRVWAGLKQSLNLWTESGNEYWLGGQIRGEVWNECIRRGKLLNPNMTVDWPAGFDYTATVKAVQHNRLVHQIWTEYGDSARHIRVLAGQHAYQGRNRGLMQQTNKLTRVDGAIGAGSGYTASFNASFSGMTMTASLPSGTIIAEQEITAVGIPPATYIVSGGGSSWQISRDVGTLSSRPVTAGYFSGMARDHFDCFATAPYFDAHRNYLDMNLFFQTQQDMIDQDLLPNSTITKADCVDPAAGNGLRYIAYEGGQQNVEYDDNGTWHSDWAAGIRAGCLDPRMGALMTRLLNGWKALGGDLFIHLLDIMGYDNVSPWGALRNVQETSSPRYDALKAYSDIGTTPSIAVTPNTLPNGTVNTAYSQTVSASGGSAPYTFSVSAGSLPGGLALNTSSGVISGSPSAAGSFNFTIRATDSASNTGSTAYAVTIATGASINISPSTLQNGTVGTPYSQTITASGDVAPYAFAVVSGAVPAGLTLAPNGVLSGTPTTTTTYNFTVRATSAVGVTATQAYTVVIAAVGVPTFHTLRLIVDGGGGVPQPISIFPTSLSNAVVGTAYSQQIGATGVVGSYTFSRSAGTLPAGMTLTSGGLLSGTPTTAGTSSFTVQVVDSQGTTATWAYTLLVAASGTVSISPSSLASATVGSAYSQTITASGGTAPYTFTVFSGSLPAGLTLTSGGVLSGTPTTAGSSTFTVRASDSASHHTDQPYTIPVSASGSNIATWSTTGYVMSVGPTQTLAPNFPVNTPFNFTFQFDLNAPGTFDPDALKMHYQNGFLGGSGSIGSYNFSTGPGPMEVGKDAVNHWDLIHTTNLLSEGQTINAPTISGQPCTTLIILLRDDTSTALVNGSMTAPGGPASINLASWNPLQPGLHKLNLFFGTLGEVILPFTSMIRTS